MSTVMQYGIVSATRQVKREWKLCPQGNGTVDVMCNNYYVLTLHHDGTYRRVGCLPEDLFQVDDEGRIREREPEDS